jgi:iron complex transport system ATP-binding protein
MKLATHHLTCGYRKKPVIRDLSLEISTGETLALLGPNGVGKTTFFKTLLGLLPPQSGRMTVDGCDLMRLAPKQRARIMAYVPQSHEVPFPYSVEEVVVMGCTVYMNSFAGPAKEDREVAAACMEELGVYALRQRVFTQLSGGERQLVLVARALAQQAEFLVMDEPASNLDFGNQMKVLDQISRLKERGKGIILTTHSPDHALSCSSRVAVFHKDHPAEVGEPHQVITAELMYRLYGVNVQLHELKMRRGKRMRMCVPCF